MTPVVDEGYHVESPHIKRPARSCMMGNRNSARIGKRMWLLLSQAIPQALKSYVCMALVSLRDLQADL